jgi:hypothetical protein
MPTLCASIKSKKHSTLRCPNPATRGEFCAKHNKSQVRWASNKPPLTRRQTTAALTIQKFWIRKGRLHARRAHGPALFAPEMSHNDKDIYSYEPIQTIPFRYHFSYIDAHSHVWTFDLRFLLQLLHYGKELKNPFSQEDIPEQTLERLYTQAQKLRKQKVPVMYTDSNELTPEQLWNQKVLDVFLRLTALGFGVNVLWFESMSASQHHLFYTRIWDMWNGQRLTALEKARIVPGHNSQRTPLFRYSPHAIAEQYHDIRWWRKTNLTLMNAFLTRGQDRDTQGCGALYILTSMANAHPRAGESFPWLVDGS